MAVLACPTRFPCGKTIIDEIFPNLIHTNISNASLKLPGMIIIALLRFMPAYELSRSCFPSYLISLKLVSRRNHARWENVSH